MSINRQMDKEVVVHRYCGRLLSHKNWASLVAQLVKNLPAMQETWVQFLGQEEFLP